MTPEVDDLKFDVERLETAVDVLAASVNAATIRAETAEGEAERLRAHLHLAGTARNSEAILRKRAEDAIASVRALCDESRVAISAGCWCDGEDDHEHTSRPLGWTLDPEQVIAALDGGAT